MVEGTVLFILTSSLIGLPVIVYWLVMGVFAIKKDQSDRTSHEASTVQAEFQKGKHKQQQEREHKNTVRLLYIQNAYQFVAYTSFSFLPGVPYFWSDGVTDGLSVIRGALYGYTSYIMFLILFTVSVICAFLFLRHDPAKTLEWYKRYFVKGTTSKYVPVPRPRQQSVQSAATSDDDAERLEEEDEAPEDEIKTQLPFFGRVLGVILGWGAGEEEEEEEEEEDSDVQEDVKASWIDIFYSHGPRAFTGILFIPVATLVFRTMACRIASNAAITLHAEKYPNMACWSTENPLQIILVVVGLLWLLILYPLSLRAAIHMNEYDPALRFLPRFLCYMIMFEFLIAFATNVFIQYPAAVTPITFFALISLASYNLYMQPALGGGTEFNHYRGAVLAGSAWGALLPIILIFIAPFQWWPIVVYGVMLPLVMIGAFRASRWRAHRMEISALNGLVEFDETIKVEKLRRTAENIANLSLLKANREKVMNSSTLERLVQLVQHSDDMVSLHAARCFGNLSADDDNRQAIADVATKALIHSCSTSNNAFVVHHASRALANLSANRACRTLLVDENTVGPLMSVVTKNATLPDHAVFMIMRTLVNLSLDVRVKESFLDDYSPVTLLKLARDKQRDASIRRTALGMVYNLSVLLDNREYIVNQRGLELLYPLSIGLKTPIEVVVQAQKCIERLTFKNPDMKLRLSRIARKLGKVNPKSRSRARLLGPKQASRLRVRINDDAALSEVGSETRKSDPVPRRKRWWQFGKTQEQDEEMGVFSEQSPQSKAMHRQKTVAGTRSGTSMMAREEQEKIQRSKSHTKASSKEDPGPSRPEIHLVQARSQTPQPRTDTSPKRPPKSPPLSPPSPAQIATRRRWANLRAGLPMVSSIISVSMPSIVGPSTQTSPHREREESDGDEPVLPGTPISTPNSAPATYALKSKSQRHFQPPTIVVDANGARANQKRGRRKARKSR